MDFDFDTFRTTANRTSRLQGLPELEGWKVAASHHDDETGMFVTVSRFSTDPGARGYQERTILVTRAGVVHWDVTIDGSGFMTTSDGVRLDGGR